MVGVARAHADVPDVASLDDVVKSLHLRGGQRLSLEAGQRRAAYRLFNRRVVVETMAWCDAGFSAPPSEGLGDALTLQDVDVIDLEALETRLHGVKDVLQA